MSHGIPSDPHSKRQSRKAAASGWIGSALEYYDFFIYATAAALLFPQLFFPTDNPTVGIIVSLASFGVGYIARPIGAVVLGHLGDRHGRKTVLVYCMFLMGFSTMCIGLLPTYDQIGVWAPAILITLRLIQGFAVAGEVSCASSMTMEHAPDGRRGYFASFTLQGVQAGQLLAAAVFLPLAQFMPADAFASWGWRIPFLLSAVVLVVGWIIRREVHEAPVFAEAQAGDKPRKLPVVEVLTESWKDVLRVVCMALSAVLAILASVFGAIYAVQPAYGIGFPSGLFMWIPVLGNLCAVILIPFVGRLSDRIGRRPPSDRGRALRRPVVVWVPLCHQHPQSLAVSDPVASHVGRGLPRLQWCFPKHVPRVVPHPGTRHRYGYRSKHRRGMHSVSASAVRIGCAAWHRKYPAENWRPDVWYLCDLRNCGVHDPRNVPYSSERTWRPQRGADVEGGVRTAAGKVQSQIEQ